jgi:two-component system nitrate/nitrite response regulator NarL
VNLECNETGVAVANKVLTVLVCPAELLREGIARALDGSEFDVIAAGCSIEQVTALAGLERPALGVLVIHKDGVRAFCHETSARYPGIKIAVLSDGLTCGHVELMRDCGVGGFLYHTISRDNLLKSLHLVFEGMCVLPTLLNDDMAPGCGLSAELLDGGDDADSGWSPPTTECLSDRELRVLEGLAEGASNKIIARRLGISDSTVKVHVKSIFRKTKMTNRVQLALWATSGVGRLSAQQTIVANPSQFDAELPLPVLRDSFARSLDIALTE